MDWTAIGKKIKEKRKDCKITQAELADRIGKTESSIRKYEKGLVAIPTDVVEKIAETLETTPYILFGPEWFDMKVGPDKVDEIQKEVTIQQGMIAILADLYGCAETKEVSSASGWCQPYYLIGTPPNTTKAFLPALVDQLKETRPEELVVQEIQRELEKIPKPEK